LGCVLSIRRGANFSIVAGSATRRRARDLFGTLIAAVAQLDPTRLAAAKLPDTLLVVGLARTEPEAGHGVGPIVKGA
jgi:hypothetical protein